ncbi:MAG: hypothetical protein Q9217_003415 [Psora testacea]
MSRRPNPGANTLAGMAAEALAMDNSTPNRHSQKYYRIHYERSDLNNVKGNPSIDTEGVASGEGSSHDSSADDDGASDPTGAEANNSDNADEDEDEDSEDPAVVAPSDHAIGTRRDQTGLNSDSVSAVAYTESTHPAPRTGQIGKIPKASNQSSGNEDQQDDDDDDDYNAVDLISDSDGEDPSIEQLEEENILNDVKDDVTLENDLGDFSIFSDGSLFPGDMPYFDEQMRRMEYSDLSGDMQIYKSTEMFHSLPSAPSPPPPTPITAARRVHFDASALKSPRSHTFEQDFLSGPTFFNDNHDDDDGESSIGSMSGYETDGETTDEDEIPVNTTKSPRALLHRPLWGLDLPTTPTPHRRSRNVLSPLSNTQRPPRLGTWFVNPGKALGQSDASHTVVILEPKKPMILDESSGDCGGEKPTATLVTGCLVAPARAPEPAVDVQFVESDLVEIADPVLGTGTNAAMEYLMEDIIRDEGLPLQSQPPSSTFMPATDVFDELGFATANSDHESTDLDIMDYMTFSDDSDSETAKEYTQTEEDAHNVLQGIQPSTEILVPLMTPGASQSQTSLSSIDDSLKDFHPSLMGGFRCGLPRAKTVAPLRRPHSGLALTRPATGGSNRHNSSTPVKFEKKRKLSDSFASCSKRPNLRTRVSSHQ